MRGVHRARLVLLGFLWVMPVAVNAHEAKPAEVGDWVRLSLVSPARRVKGILVGRVTDTLEVQTGPPGFPNLVRVPLPAIRIIEVSSGRRHAMGKSILLGTGIGAVAGVLLGAAEGSFEGASGVVGAGAGGAAARP